MAKRVLITGGAGFIGSHLADKLLEIGIEVRILDNLCEQVHGTSRNKPSYLNPCAELIIGDIRDKAAVEKSLKGVDIVYHLAAKVGVGQSMYEIAGYTDTNNLGTAVLLESIIQHPVGKLVVASSMSVYGEGLYRKKDGSIIPGKLRSIHQLKKGIWELFDENNEELQPVPTNEEKRSSLASVYALSKYDQERLCLMMGNAYRIPVVSLRLFNVYGPRQALSNPYTGMLAIFASRFLNGTSPLVFEDGKQRRDYVNVKDAVRACLIACEKKEANGEVFNIGSGTNYTVNEIALHLKNIMGVGCCDPVITHKYRAGDIRHCFSDITKAKNMLGYEPSVDIDTGLTGLVDWLSTQRSDESVDQARKELEKRGLTL